MAWLYVPRVYGPVPSKWVDMKSFVVLLVPPFPLIRIGSTAAAIGAARVERMYVYATVSPRYP